MWHTIAEAIEVLPAAIILLAAALVVFSLLKPWCPRRSQMDSAEYNRANQRKPRRS